MKIFSVKMLDGSSNKFALELYLDTFEKVSKHLIYSYRQFIENELLEYTKKEDGKFWVISEGNLIKPEEYIRNVLIGRKYLRNKELKKNHGIKHLEFHPEVGELNEDKKHITGNHDIKVTGLSLGIIGEADEDIYFSFECKRLNDRAQNHTEYVNSGIRRYVTGQYSEKMPLSGMIGFIEENTPKYFVDKINDNLDILNKRRVVITKQVITNLKFVSNFEYTYYSIHKKNNRLNEITIYHFMFPIDTIIKIIDEEKTQENNVYKK